MILVINYFFRLINIVQEKQLSLLLKNWVEKQQVFKKNFFFIINIIKGAEICNRIISKYNIPEYARKTLSYRINALLASKASTIFEKDSIIVEGSRKASGNLTI